MEKSLLKINHDLATVFADTIVADSEEMKSFVHPRYHDKTIYLSYGVDIPPEVPWNAKYLKTLKNYQDNPLNAHDYFLVIARLEPENNIHTIVEAYARAETDSPLVVIGDYTSQKYEDEINKIIKESSGENIQFLGSVYNKKILDMLRQNCKAYLHGHSVGGTNPSLLEAAVCSDTIIAHDNPFNREVCQECAFYFQDSSELSQHLESMDLSGENISKDVFNQVHQEYSWDKISSDYQKVINSLVI
jgi:rhamnosyltransferase